VHENYNGFLNYFTHHYEFCKAMAFIAVLFDDFAANSLNNTCKTAGYTVKYPR
jgi:hypothetical protein